MRKRDWFIVIVPLLITWIIDRITKMWAIQLTTMKSFGYLGFVLHHNQGAMLGLFSDLPAVLRIVSLSTGGAFLVCTYAIIQYLLPIKSLTLRSGMSILLGGILGNVTDRIIWGYVVDFIVVGNTSLTSPAFNMADALQWIGYFLIVYAIVRESELLWPENDLRKKVWINPQFQIRYSFILVGVGLGLTLVSSVFSYTYLRVTIHELVGANGLIANRFLIPFSITFSIMTIAFSAILFLVGRILSHRVAGPVYAFEKYLNDLSDGKNRQFKLRQGDEFKHLEQVAEKIQSKLQMKSESNSTEVAANEKIESSASEK